jgi:hypothetical protein
MTKPSPRTGTTTTPSPRLRIQFLPPPLRRDGRDGGNPHSGWVELELVRVVRVQRELVREREEGEVEVEVEEAVARRVLCFLMV